MRGERLVVLMLMMTAGCVSPTRPDLHRLYAFDIGAENPPPVVLIHGFMASKLRDRETGEEIWLRSAGHAAATGYLDLALDMDPETLEPLPSSAEPFALAPLAGDLGLDDHILDVLSGPGGYAAGRCENLRATGLEAQPNRQSHRTVRSGVSQSNNVQRDAFEQDVIATGANYHV